MKKLLKQIYDVVKNKRMKRKEEKNEKIVETNLRRGKK